MRRATSLVGVFAVVLGMAVMTSAANADVVSTQCSASALLATSSTLQCTTPPVVCPIPPAGLRICFFSTKVTASAPVSLGVAARATDVVSGTKTATTPPGPTETISKTDSASCSNPQIGLNVSCSATTRAPTLGSDTNLYWYAGTNVNSPTRDLFTSSGTGTCTWTGSALGVLGRITCVETVESFPF